MLTTLIVKELRAILASPKFVATFGACSILILLSVFVGIREYRAAVAEYDAAIQLTDQTLRSQASWMGMSSNAYRTPDPAQILITGVTNDIGRLSAINQFTPVKLTHSAYADDPIFALFRAVDFSFIVTVVLSLFAVLFTYDAVSGEREGGTLQLTFANPVPRGTFILAKLIGSWLGLVIPLAIPLLLGLLVIMLNGIPFTADHWSRLALFTLISIAYFTFFIAFGVCVSALTRRSAVSFLVALVAWVILVLIVPRLGVMAAGRLKPVPSVAEVEAQRDAFAKDRWESHMQEMQERWRVREQATQGMSKEQREAYRDDHLAAWMEEDDGKRKEIQKDIDEFSVRLNEDLRNRKADQEAMAFTLTRVSPASSYQLASMSLAGTDIGLKSRSEDAMRGYRTRFMQYVEKKQKETGSQGGFRITVDSDKGFSFSAPRDRGTLDLSDLPVYSSPLQTFASAAAPVVLDAGLLALYSLLAFAGAVAGFFRYDVR
jgi:ABC-type transport system involved in multi-copper enzyme maturation permease subunit